MYRKLKRVWSHNDINYIPNFQKVFPELSKIDSEELCDRFIELNIEFYCEEETPVNFWIRLTLPFAIFTMLLMILVSPISFLITGKWGYSLGQKNRLLNWFRALKLQ
jgi:hypothetical protein